MSNLNPVYVGNDNVIEVRNVKNEVTGAYLNAATVSVSLTDDTAGTQIVGDTWPKTMDYVAASDGVYRATLPFTLVLTVGQLFTATISLNSGTGLHASWSIPCVARARD